MRTFGVTLNAGIAFRVRSSYKESLNPTCVLSEWPKVQVLHLGLGYDALPSHGGETHLRVSQSQVAELRLGSTLPASNSRKG
jgi:hypothetical protein